MGETKEALNKETILGVADAQIVSVPVPEWDLVVYVRGLTGTDRDAFETWVADRREKAGHTGLRGVRARLCVLTIVDKEGNRLFADADEEQLGKKSGKVLDRLWQVAMRVSGLQEGDVKELIEGFPGAQSGDSISA